MSNESTYKKYSKMTEGEIRAELFSLIGDAIGQENMHLVPTSEIKSLLKAYGNSKNEKLLQEIVTLKNSMTDRMHANDRTSLPSERVEYPKCPTCGHDVFGQAYVGANLKELTLYCSNIECTGYRVRFVDLKRKIV